MLKVYERACELPSSPNAMGPSLPGQTSQLRLPRGNSGHVTGHVTADIDHVILTIESPKFMIINHMTSNIVYTKIIYHTPSLSHTHPP